MPRPAAFALLLLLAVPPSEVLAQERAPAPANTLIAPLQSTTSAPAARVPPLPEAKTVGGSDDCAAALRREGAAHQEKAAETQTPPAPLELPPECGGAPTPPASK